MSPVGARNIIAMEMSPQAVRSTGFKLVKRGYDPEEVDAFKEQVASAVEFAQNQATAMEARARAAVAKLQEVSQQVQSGESTPAGTDLTAAADADAASLSASGLTYTTNLAAGAGGSVCFRTQVR